MTRTALDKIILCLGAFLVIFCLCVAIDGVIPDANRNESLTSEETADQHEDEQGCIGAADGSTTSDPALMSTDQKELFASLIKGESSCESFANTFLATSISSELPTDITTEVMDKAGFINAYSSGSQLSYLFDGELDAAREECARKLSEKGWSRVDEGDGPIESFCKFTGSYRWLVVQYLTFDSTTTLLITLMPGA